MRTFCYLEDTMMLEPGDVVTSPLVAISEVSVEGDKGVDEGDEETGSTKAMYEYSVTVVDTVTGVVTLGHFVNGVLRSRMRTFLVSFGPSKASASIKSSSNESVCSSLAYPGRVPG